MDDGNCNNYYNNRENALFVCPCLEFVTFKHKVASVNNSLLILDGGNFPHFCFMVEFSFSYKELFDAYEDCLKNKKNSSSAILFTQNYIEKVIELCDQINNRTYKIGTSNCFVIKYPKYREVFAAEFRDRIVHHLVINELMPYFEKYFIKESFSCMIGRGTLYGVNTMYEYMNECTENYTKEAYVLKMDIKNFFMNIDKLLLAKMLDDFIVEKYEDNRKKECLRWLCNMIIMHHPEDNCVIKCSKELWKALGKGKSLFDIDKAKGLAIGNLTSQLFANFYMTKMDYFIKNNLGFKYYGRYVDDFLIFDTDKEKLKKSIKLIREFCRVELMLDLHPNKIYLQNCKHGVNFIGAVIMPNRIYCGNRTIGQFYNKLYSIYRTPNKNDVENFVSSVNSYLGYMKHYSSYNKRKEILIKSGLLEAWKEYITINDDLLKISIKNE